MTLVHVDDVALNVREWGDASLPAVVFWHALGPAGSAETINEVAPVLVERGRRVVGIDGPGFGESPLLPPERARHPGAAPHREHLPRFEAALPEAEVRWIEGAGHGLLTDVGPELGDLIADWLDG